MSFTTISHIDVGGASSAQAHPNDGCALLMKLQRLIQKPLVATLLLNESVYSNYQYSYCINYR